MTTLVVSVTDDFSADTLSGIDVIEFANLAGTATASFAASQFDNAAILDSVLLRGSAGANALAITGGSINAGSWQFEDWVFGDTITLTGTGLADTITGSSLSDVIIGAGGRDTIAGGGGADDLSGGGGNDRIVYDSPDDDGDIQFFEQVDGGNGTADKIVLDDSFDGLSLFFTTIVNVEALVFRTAGSAQFSGAAFATGGIATVTGSSGQDQLKVAGPAIDLSAVTFANWTEMSGGFDDDIIFAYGLGATDDVITGSGLADLIHGFSGNDVLDGGGGNDTLYGDEGRDTISGGGGDDTLDYQNDTMIEVAESIDGGSGTDSLMLHEADPGETYDFTTSIMAGVEVLSIIGPSTNADTVTVKFAEGQFGAGGINAAVINSPLAIEISAGAVDLSTVIFSGLTDETSISLNGITGADVLIGGTLADIITGGSGLDVMLGEADSDTFVYEAESDIGGGEFVDGGGGTDTLELSGDFSGHADLRQMIIAKVEAIAMLGGGQTVAIRSDMLADLTAIEAVGGFQSLTVRGGELDLSGISFTGWSATDLVTLNGTGSIDVIAGSGENDVIAGGGDGDDLSGNAGADVFVYRSIDNSTTGTGRDLIDDFTQTEDIIDLSPSGVIFTFIAADEFGGAGTFELRYEFTASGNTEIQGDSDGDGNADMNILLTGEFTLHDSDFILVP